MRSRVLLLLAASAVTSVSCKKEEAGPPEFPPAHVSVISAEEETITLSRDLPGRVEAVRLAEVRARVAGILLERTFTEGANVKAGDVLFKIDPAPLEAAKGIADAALAKAKAALKQAEAQAKRYSELVDVNAISRQDFDNAVAAVDTAKAEILSAEAAIRSADLDLAYATVTAPIDGRIGKALVTEGTLVGQADVTKLAVIQQLDPVYVDFTQSSTELLRLRRAIQSGKLDEEKASTVKLILDDGSVYEHEGKLLFSEVSVDETTGMVSMRAQFENPDHLLLPGMFARVRVEETLKEPAITLPQQAVTRAQGGMGSILVVDESNVVHARMIQTGPSLKDRWVVTEGLKRGEQVVMEGHMKAHPGATVVVEPYMAPSSNKEDQPPSTESPATN